MTEPAPASASPAVDPVLRETARAAWNLGLLAGGLAMISPCTSGMTMLGALPLGLAALNRARVVLESPTPVDEATQLYAQTGKITGLGAAIFSGLYIAVVGTFIVMYIGFIALIVGAASSTLPSTTPIP